MADNKALQFFVHEALSRGQSRKAVEAALIEAGWSESDVSSALQDYAEIDFPVPVPRPRPSLTARDAFHYLVLFGSLYVAAFGLGELLYGLINSAFPDPAWNDTWDDRIATAIRWAIAKLVVASPIFLLMVRSNAKALVRYPAMRTSPVRRWLTYLTLAIVSGILIGDAITLLYRVLSGELTVRFGLKALALAAISGGIFFHYMRDLKRDEREGGA